MLVSKELESSDRAERIAHAPWIGRREIPPLVRADWTAASGYQAGAMLSRMDSVTAVFTANDHIALGLLRALHERGKRVPQDVSVVGFDDVPEAAYYWPPLTTVNQDFGTLGRRALELTLRALDGEAAPVAALVEPALVVRESTGPGRSS